MKNNTKASTTDNKILFHNLVCLSKRSSKIRSIATRKHSSIKIKHPAFISIFLISIDTNKLKIVKKTGRGSSRKERRSMLSDV